MDRKPVKTIRLLSTSLPTGTLMSDLFKKEFPEAVVYNIVDDSIVREILSNNNTISSDIVKRVCGYVISAEMSGAELVVICCSTISGLAVTARKLVSMPVVGIDEPMMEKAVKQGETVMVLATMPSTLSPSLRLLQDTCQRFDKSVVIDSVLCTEARCFLDAGNAKQHDALLTDEINKALQSYDVVVLAQASMARVCGILTDADRKRVLTSPSIAVESIRKQFLTDTERGCYHKRSGVSLLPKK